MKRLSVLISMVIFLCVSASDVTAESAQVLLEKGIYTEESVGDLDEAMGFYRKVINGAKTDRRYVAEAYFRLGVCHARKGAPAEAQQAFTALITQFPANTKLVARAKKQQAALPARITGAVGGSSPIHASAHLVLVDSAAVPAIEERLKVDLDPATGRVFFTKKEAGRIWDALGADASAHVLAELSTATQSGMEAAVKSVREVIFEADGRQGITREVGSILRVLPEIPPRGGQVVNTVAFDSCDILGMQKVAGNPDIPLFETFATQFSFLQKAGQQVLLHGTRGIQRDMDHVTYSDSLSAKLRGRSIDYFLFFTCEPAGNIDTSTVEAAQVLLTCRFLDLGPAAQRALKTISGIQGMTTSTMLTQEKFVEVLAALEKTTDDSTMVSMPILARSGKEAVVKWVQEVIFNAGTRLETREYGAISAVLPEISPEEDAISLSLKTHMVMPVAVRGAQKPDSPATMDMTRGIIAKPGETLLSVVSAPEGILESGHKCYVAVTARLVGKGRDH